MGRAWPRRRFLAAASATAIAGPALLSACADDGSTTTATSTGGGGPNGAAPNVFRRSTRHVRQPCRACVAHARNRYYPSAEAAAADPAHPGCGCEVRGQRIPDDQLAGMFIAGAAVFDKRSG